MNPLSKIRSIFSSIATRITKAIQGKLKKFDKVVTSETINSVQTSVELKGTESVILTASGSIVFEYIEQGRAKGAKRPVRKVGERFELFPRLENWRKIVVPSMSPYVLAETIHRKGIKPTPVIEEATKDVNSIILKGQEQLSLDISNEIQSLIIKGISVNNLKI